MNLYNFAAVAAAIGSDNNPMVNPSGNKKKNGRKGPRKSGSQSCVNIGVDAMCCINENASNGYEGCLKCMMDVFAEAGDASCTDLENSSFCDDIDHCVTEEDHCNSGVCGDEMDAFLACEAAVAESPCPGLCEDQLGYSVGFAIA